MEPKNLSTYCLRRLIQSFPLLVAVVVVNFVIIQLAPGDPVTALIGEFPATPEYVEQVREQYGLNKPAWQQLVNYLTTVAQGDLGYSFANRQPVLELILGRLGATLLLTVTAFVLSVIIGTGLGVISSLRPYSLLDNLGVIISLIGYSMPVFWVGQLLILVFAVHLDWLPTSGMRTLRFNYQGWDAAKDIGLHLVLPVLAIMLRSTAVNTRIARASMLEVLGNDYVRTARAKGLPERIVVARHAFRNALLPVLTLTGFELGFLAAGSMLVETVFGWPGIGRLLYDSITARDYPVILGVFLIISITVILATLITDILSALFDPRIRF